VATKQPSAGPGRGPDPRRAEIAESDVDDDEYYRSIIALRAGTLAAGNEVSAALELEQCMMGAMCYYPDDPELVARRERYWQGRLAEAARLREGR
jgi:hypothetical protein